MKIVDTDILIDHLRGVDKAIEYLAELNGEVRYVSVITVAEILAGIREKEETKTERLLRQFTKKEVTEEIARKTGEYLKKWSKSHSLELGDSLIAATAYVSKSDLVTRNEKHYPMDDIKVIVPYRL